LPSAIARLREDSKKASGDVLELLNIIVDSYCFKNKNVDNMEFLKLRLRRKFDDAEARYRRIMSLLEDAWWEQCFGLHYALGFKRVMSRNYAKFVGSLLADLRTLSYAMYLEEYGRLHLAYMAVLKREIYVIQTRSNDVLNEISTEVQALSPRTCINFPRALQMHDELRMLCYCLAIADLDLKSVGALENQVEMALYKFRTVQNRTLRKEAVAPDEVAGNVPLNLFLFSLNSFCSTLISFQHIHNSKVYDDAHRVKSFLRASLRSVVNPAYYKDLELWIHALKITLAIMSGVAFSVGIYGFSASVPSVIAYIMSNSLGSSFKTTVNRVGGVVVGSIVPSVFKFFFVQMCAPAVLDVLLSNVVMLIWVAMCMYVFFGRGYGSYGGMVAAFVASDTLQRQTDICYPNGSDSSSSVAIASYSYLAQTSVAVVIFIAIETFIFPKSAISLLRRSILDTLKLHQRAFELLFGHHLSSSVEMDEAAMAEVRRMLVVQIPTELERQRQLLLEAQVEPLLWRPEFSAEKYRRVVHISQQLLHNNYLLFKLLRWLHFREAQTQLKLNPADIRDDVRGHSAASHAKWELSTSHFQALVRDNFETMEMIFSDGFRFSEPDQTAVYMQIKEAFRLADKDCSGELNADDVAIMLSTIFAQSGAVKQDEVKTYVQEFMKVVGKPGRATVSFEDFMDALEHGLKLEVEVYRNLKPKAPALLAGNLPVGIKDEQGVNLQSEGAKEGEARLASGVEEPSVHVSCEQQDHVTSVLPTENASVFLRHEYDVLNVEDFSTSEVVAHMKAAYVEWLLADKRYERTSMEEQLLLSCLVSGAESIAKSLSALEEIAMAS